MGDITKHAKINRATFYAHYADKYDLMEDALSMTFGSSGD
ncbi:TetR family transcriptional regulator [Paenibacillus sp. CCS19]